MKKRWQVLLSVVLVMVFSVSFSVPVFASELDELEGDVVYITSGEELDAYKVSEGQVDLFSVSRASTGTFSDTVAPFRTIIESSTCELEHLLGTYDKEPAYNLFFDVIGSYYSCTGYYVYYTGVTADLRSHVASPNYNALLLSFSTSASHSVSFYSSDLAFCRSNGYPYWAVGPSDHVSSIADLTPIALNRFNSTIVPFTSLGGSGAYSIYYVQPFYSYTRSLPIFSNQNMLTFSFTVSQFSATYNSHYGSLTPSDIQKQTDTLTTGYDNSGMESTNSQLSSSLTEYDNTESQVMDQSVQYIDAVTFFDPTTHLQLMSCITYTSTFLQDLFVALGDWSVLVLIALSLAFALMLIGWFKYRS